VAGRAADCAAAFGWAEAACVAGQLHDIGKCSEQFQAYIRGNRPRGGDHSAPGARVAAALCPPPLHRMLATAIAGHHAGLADWTDLAPRLSAEAVPPAEWASHGGTLAAATALAGPIRQRRPPEKGFPASFLTRMLFSCLVDADFLETECFYAQAHGETVVRGGHPPLEELRGRLTGFMAATLATAPRSALNDLRAQVLRHALDRAGLPPGLFHADRADRRRQDAGLAVLRPGARHAARAAVLRQAPPAAQFDRAGSPTDSARSP
jgi:CRISPR-associated endonuclease/helicase Cas3